MPGRLIMNSSHATDGSPDLKKDRSKAQEAGLPPKPDFDQHKPHDNGSLPNGVSGQSAVQSITNGHTANVTESQQSPPQLDQSWRESDANKSMGKLIDRLAQQCFEDLAGQLHKMSEEPATSLQNGDVPRSDDPAIKKKRTFMEFAHNQRDRFIKTLVLSDWAKHAGDDMAKLVDIKVWQEKQSFAQRNAIHSIGLTKHEVGRMKMPNPNIQGALQLLSTGRASSKIPDLGYIPPKRLTAKQLLRVLQGMNVSLATRLNLHEELPFHFNDFSVANGRATFRVPGEFEVDLSLADEEPSSPFYFIDVRFSFSPAPRALDETIRGQFEMRINSELASKGLQGCYQFLHNYVLTHKINVIREQMLQIRAEKWFDCVGVERKHRVLTVQYWKGQPGKKSWLEVGIGTGNQDRPRARRPVTSQLTVRWFRKGQLADESIDFDWVHLDAAKILSEVIARHSSLILTQMKEGLEKLAGVKSKLEIDLQLSTSTPEDCSLRLKLAGMEWSNLIQIEPATGWISVTPYRDRVSFYERGLNHDDKTAPSQILAHLLCKMVQDRVANAAERARWKTLDQRSMKLHNFKGFFGDEVLSWKHYRCSEAWNDRCAVLVTFSLWGEAWWVVRLEEQPGDPGQPPVAAVASARRLYTSSAEKGSAEKDNSETKYSRTSMLQIEKLAAAEVSFMTLSQQLDSMKIPHRLEKQASLIFDDSSSVIGLPPTMAIFFRGKTGLKDSAGKDLALASIKITHLNLYTQRTGVGDAVESRQEICVTFDTTKMTHLKEFLTAKNGNAEIALTAAGSLATRLRTPFGQPYVEQVFERIQACERLNHYLQVLQHYKFECVTASLHKLSFTYSQTPQLRAILSFPRGNGKLPAALKLEPPTSNPHHRVRIMLEKLFNNGNLKDRFSIMCKSLSHSVGIMQVFEKLELAHRTDRAITIHTRHPLLFTLVYKAPFLALSFKVELRERREGTKSIIAWKIQAETAKQELATSETGKQILELSKERTPDWWGFEDGCFTAWNSNGITDVLGKLDTIMQKSASVSNGVLPKQEETETSNVKPVSVSAAPKDSAPQNQKSKQTAQNVTASNPAQQRANGLPSGNNMNGPRMMTVNATASPKGNSANGRNNQANVKKEVIELD